jgi:hypothetical protein
MTNDTDPDTDPDFEECRPHFDAFRDEDDMITLDTYSTLAGKSHLSSQRRSDIRREESRQSTWKSQFVLEQVEETILDRSRPSDEITRIDSLVASLNYEQDDTDEEDDDSTNVVPTVVAADRLPKSSNNAQNATDANIPTGSSRHLESNAMASFHRPSHIVVDTSSPAHTNLTMDATMMNDNIALFSVLGDDDDNISIMTPILDRYRLDVDDDCSIGVKVVPNTRGLHSRNTKQSFCASTTRIAAKSTLPTVYSGEKPIASTPVANLSSGFFPIQDMYSPASLPAGLPGSVSARKKTLYRKTPHPKKKVSHQNWTEQDENEHPNMATSTMSLEHSVSTSKSPFASISIPPLRSPKTPSAFRPFSMPGSSGTTATIPRTPLTPAFVEKHTLPSYAEPYVLHTATDSTFEDEHSAANAAAASTSRKCHARQSRSPLPVRKGKWMEDITMAEYDGAPRVVRMQVAHDEANKAVGALQDFLGKLAPDQNSLSFTEQQAYEVLGECFSTDRKSKSVLMSLCHFRRLLMHRDERQVRLFSVNQFED